MEGRSSIRGRCARWPSEGLARTTTTCEFDIDVGLSERLEIGADDGGSIAVVDVLSLDHGGVSVRQSDVELGGDSPIEEIGVDVLDVIFAVDVDMDLGEVLFADLLT